MTSPSASAALVAAMRQLKLDTLEGAFAYGGGDDLAKPGLGHRRRTRIVIPGRDARQHVVFLKRYLRDALLSRLRRWWTYGPGRSPAAVEADNIRRVRQAGVTDIEALAWGQDRRRSYVVMSQAPGQSLELCGPAFLEAQPHRAGELTAKLAELARRLHGAGLVHRDLYACHVFLDDTPTGLELGLIDLARVFRPRWRTFRWRVKDLAQLNYSMPPAWVRQEWERFLELYCGQTISRERLRHAIDRKAARMRRWKGRPA